MTSKNQASRESGPTEHYDVIVIGSGAAGLSAAVAAADRGASVLVIGRPISRATVSGKAGKSGMTASAPCRPTSSPSGPKPTSTAGTPTARAVLAPPNL